MSEYDKLFVRSMRIASDDLDNEGPAIGEVRPGNISDPFALMSSEDVPASSVHMAYSWIMPTSSRVHWVNEHAHDYDEVLMWMGSDPTDPHDLGGEIALDIDGETHLVTTTGSVFIPGGVKHCPLEFVHVERPFSFIALSLGGGAYASSYRAPSPS